MPSTKGMDVLVAAGSAVAGLVMHFQGGQMPIVIPTVICGPSVRRPSVDGPEKMQCTEAGPGLQ